MSEPIWIRNTLHENGFERLGAYSYKRGSLRAYMGTTNSGWAVTILNKEQDGASSYSKEQLIQNIKLLNRKQKLERICR